MSHRIKGRVAVVTGASRGIGMEVARLLVAEGAKVVLAARDKDRIEQLSIELGDHAVAIQTDVTNRNDVSAMADLAMSHFGSLDILINNAGVGLTGIVADVDLDSLEHVFSVNVFGAVSCIQACIPHMRRQQWGHIVNVSSILGKRAVPQTSGYAATKFALHALSDGLRVEEAPHGISVSVVCPGSTDTDFRANELKGGTTLLNERPRVNMKSAADVAKITVNAIKRKKREVVISPFGVLFNTVEKVAPGALDMLLARTYHK